MSSCLFECLKEAGLERYHSTLQRRGYDTAFSLLYLPPAELQDVGIATDSDRQRFLQLVQIIASFHQGGELSPRRCASPVRNPKAKSAVRKEKFDARPSMTNSRQLEYQSSDSGSTSEESPPGYIPSPRRRPCGNLGASSNTGVSLKQKYMPVPVLPSKIFHHNKTHSAMHEGVDIRRTALSAANRQFNDFSQGDDNNNVPYPERCPVSVPSTEDSDEISSATRNIRMSAESLKVQRVMRTKGYNYGLPRDGHKQNGANGLTPKMQRKVSSRNSTPSNLASQNSREVPRSPQGRCRITVCVRKRPVLETERLAGEFDVITCNREDGGKDGGLVVHELKHTVDMAEFVQQNVFQFDKVFTERSTNRELYEHAVKTVVDWIMTQNNRATCFGYGQTGAGKTHTLLGDDTEWGVFFHAAKDVLSRLNGQSNRTNRGKRGFALHVSLYEIYCSRIFDLLNDHKRLQALEDSNKQIHIHGLQSVHVRDMSALQGVVEQGLSARSVGVTGANRDSSRSHAIVQLSVRDAAGTEFSRLSFIDLAGSERACDALRDSDKQNRLEGAEINQSLLALKECIRSLDLALAHTPFRQSKLTQVLRDSFIGNSKTCMIANISPSHSSLEHTMNTLRYASRVKELHRKPALSTPRQQRNRFSTISARSARQRPHTADPTYSHSTPAVAPPGSTGNHISRSVSIDCSTRVMDYTTAFTGQGRELARTPPPTRSNNLPSAEQQQITQQGTESAEDRHQVAEGQSKGVPMRKSQSVFTPEAIAASSTPNKRQKTIDNRRSSTNNSPREISTSDSASSNTPASTPRFLNDTEPVGGLPLVPNVNQNAESTNTTNDKGVSVATTATRDTLTETYSNSSSVAVEPGSSRGKTSKQDSCSSRGSSSVSTGEVEKSGQGFEVEVVQKEEESKSQRSSKTSTSSDETENQSLVEDAKTGTGLPESTKNPGLPSPKKFLTYLKDKHSIKTKALKLQLRKAKHRMKQNTEEDAQSSDHSASSSSRSTNPTYSTSRDNLTSNVQQHHQQISLQTDSATPVSAPIVANPQTPPRLPSPKLDRSHPRRSMRIRRGSSPRSASPGTGGRTTPDEQTSTASSVSNPATMTGLMSVSELHARLAAAAAVNSHSDSDDAPKVSPIEKPLPSSSEDKTLKTSRGSSSSDKENKDARSKLDENVHRAQSEVIIAHQEHISEILRISIEEERLYHELRDQWGKGTPFETYTRSLRKLLARKTQSIEALKIQLGMYDRVCNAPG